MNALTVTAKQHQETEVPKATGLAARRLISGSLRRHVWLPAAASVGSGVAVVIAQATDLGLPFTLAAAGFLAITSFVWGYWTQVRHGRLFPPLTHLHRRQYAATWDLLAGSLEEACASAGRSVKDEGNFRASAASTIKNLLELAQIRQSDHVLEIGCGVGRIGRELAPHCHTWTGADISINMLGHASARLQGIPNFRLIQLHGEGLAEIESNSFDVVYFTDMLMHLDEMDRWQYVEESFRVLRPGGRIFMDVIDIESDAGWKMFTNNVGRYKNLERPPYMPRFPLAAELAVHMEKAQFEGLQIHRRSPLVVVTGVRPRCA
ncbi:MAG TPA: class I SAM-dependent methyltransferase [Candidatus Sulfotelmatobacter sp.]|jgi:SAM-dependent methyltransferase|nr:class I SAM-dependent methyltransferase [Candidatus Sulfotelmatobacter sp.]